MIENDEAPTLRRMRFSRRIRQLDARRARRSEVRWRRARYTAVSAGVAAVLTPMIAATDKRVHPIVVERWDMQRQVVVRLACTPTVETSAATPYRDAADPPHDHVCSDVS